LEPIARSNVYFIVSPTGSGPVNAAVAISGYCMDRAPRTSSKVICGFGSGSFKPANMNSRRIGIDFIVHLLQLSGVRPMIETFPLEKAAEGYARMMSGDAEFRVVLTM
jgi:D-arabinose 1-dehydrogenase-like Zn-dependent alcohol dehydrogenase